MTDAEGSRREALRKGLTRVGGGDAEIPLSVAGADQLHVWDMPPRAIFVGGGEAPRLNGNAFDEVPLRPGDHIEWLGVRLTYGGDVADADQAQIEEIAVQAQVPAATASPALAPGLSDAEARILKRVQAGMFVELGIADRPTAKRWQDSVVAGKFDPDACARDLLAKSQVATDDPRLVERSGRLLRDFLMAPLMTGVRGASRRARQAAQGGAAFLIAQGMALLVFLVIVLVALLLLRFRGISIDDFLDRVLFRD